jgi:predicted hydrocarbon binding protein
VPFHVDRFRISFKEVVGESPSSVFRIKFSEYRVIKTSVKKAHFIKKLMDRLLAKYPKRTAKKIMLECGYMMRDGVSHCINEHRIKTARALFAESKNLKDFIGKLSKHGGGKLTLEGNSIKAVYDRCYCGSVSKTREKIPLIFCYCGAGWYKRLFEEVLGSPVRVEVVQSIANGADQCVLRISGFKS